MSNVRFCQLVVMSFYFGNFKEIYSESNQSHYFKRLSTENSQVQGQKPKGSAFEGKIVGGKRDIGDFEKQNSTKMFENHTFSRDQSPENDLAKKNIPPVKKRKTFKSHTFKRENPDNKSLGKNNTDGEGKKPKRTKNVDQYTFSRDHKGQAQKSTPANFKEIKKNKLDTGENPSLIKHFVSHTFKRENPDNAVTRK